MIAIPGNSEGTRNITRIERYFPECFAAAVESVAKTLFGFSDFGKIYGRHTFHFQKPSGTIAFKENQIDLDLNFHCVPLAQSEICSRIESIYGIVISQVEFHDYEGFWNFCLQSIEENTPFISDFSIACVKGRREYHKDFSPHNIVIFAHDADKRQIHSVEQVLGFTSISYEDLSLGFESYRSCMGEFLCFKLSLSERGERNLVPSEILSEIDSNLENLNSPLGSMGLRGLLAFRNGLADYLASPSFSGKPFSIPGMWVFAHERHFTRKWLRHVGALFPGDGERDFFNEFDELFIRLHKSWLHIDFLVEKCLIAGLSKGLEKLPAYLDSILALEMDAEKRWRKLRALVSSL